MHSTLRPSVFLGEQAGRSGSPPVKWFILRVLGDVPSATTVELTQTMSIRGRAAARSARGGRNGDRRDRPARPADHSPLSACTPPVGPRPRPRYRIGRGEIVNAGTLSGSRRRRETHPFDGVFAAGPGGRDGDRRAGVLVAAAERGLAAVDEARLDLEAAAEREHRARLGLRRGDRCRGGSDRGDGGEPRM